MEMTIRRSGWTRLGVCFVIFAMLLACKKKREPLSFIADPPIAKARNYTLTVGTAKECDAGKKNFAPEPGFVHLGVELTFEATTDPLLHIRSYPMKLKGPGGQIYRMPFAHCQPEFPLPSSVQKGERQHGFLTFEVPEDSTSLLLTYEHQASLADATDTAAIILKR
jgi:hypothetical protein